MANRRHPGGRVHAPHWARRVIRRVVEFLTAIVTAIAMVAGMIISAMVERWRDPQKPSIGEYMSLGRALPFEPGQPVWGRYTGAVRPDMDIVLLCRAPAQDALPKLAARAAARGFILHNDLIPTTAEPPEGGSLAAARQLAAEVYLPGERLPAKGPIRTVPPGWTAVRVHALRRSGRRPRV